MNDVAATVAITGMNATDNPAPGVGVARALRHEPTFRGRLIGLGYDPLDPGFYADRLLDGGGLLPYPSIGREAFRERLLDLTSRFQCQALIPTLDSELRLMVSLADELRARGVGTCLPPIEAIERVSKPQLPQLAAAGIPVPESEALTTPDRLARLGQRFGWPLVVKGAYYGAAVVHHESDAVAAFHAFAAQWGVPVVVQRFVAGDEYNVCALGDGTGATVGAVAMRKLALTDKGKGWSGVTVANPSLLALAEKLMAALHWRGPLEVELIATRGTRGLDDVRVIEINPRFPAWAFLTAAAGQNLPFACACLALGLPAPVFGPYEAGRLFVRIAVDQIASLSTFGSLSATGVLPVEVARS